MAKPTGADAHRDRILKAALSLLTKQGRDSVTTRSVAEAAGVQAPVLYRIFGDKVGLLDAVAAFGFKAYLAKKQAPESLLDPVEALRAGWDLHVGFGLANPELYLLMYANPRPGTLSPTARQSFERLAEHMQRVASAGLLRVSVARACALYHAGAVGIVMSLLGNMPEQRDLSISSAARDNALIAITMSAPPRSNPKVATAANHLRSLLTKTGHEPRILSEAEQTLLSEWLLRLTE